MRECFLNVVDISEDEALDVLQIVMESHHNSQKSASVDSMAIDEEPEREVDAPIQRQNAPPLRTLFAYVVNYAGSLQAWRLAIHKRFPRTEQLLELLEVIEEWMKIYGSKDLPLSLGETKVNEQGVPVPKVDHSKKLERIKGMLLPPLDKV